MEGWYMVDAALRSLQKMEIPQGVYDSPPRQILTKENITDPKQPYVGVPGFQDQFKKLWKVQ
jgi:hypothetical protein